MKAIIFDFDGVIQDTFDFHKGNMERFGNIELSDNEFKDLFSGNFFANKVNKTQNIDWPAYTNFIYHGQSNLKIADETKETLLKLNKNYLLFIISSSKTKNIKDYLKNNKIVGIFKEVLGMDSHKSKIEKFKSIFAQYKLTADDCIFITDTLGDILEANAVGVKTIAVDFGFHDRETLSKGNPSKIVSSLDELMETIGEAKRWKP